MMDTGKILNISAIFEKCAQMGMEAPDKWKFEEVLYRAGLFPRNQAGTSSPAFERMWLALLTKLAFEGDYSVSLTIPAGSFNAKLSVTSSDPKAKQLEKTLNNELAPKMTQAMQAMNGKVISGTDEKFGPSTQTHNILLIST